VSGPSPDNLRWLTYFGQRYQNRLAFPAEAEVRIRKALAEHRIEHVALPVREQGRVYIFLHGPLTKQVVDTVFEALSREEAL
jgi:hypothetical protein